MPAENCSIISVKFMDAICRGEVYMPKMTEVRAIRIAKPPHKKHLKEELLKAMAAQVTQENGLNLMENIRKKDVDVYWMGCLLFMLNPNHEFFDKSYTRATKNTHRADPLMINEDKFQVYNEMFAGLPIPKQKKKPYVASSLMREPRPTRLQ